jgi:dienelactone hydrolase
MKRTLFNLPSYSFRMSVLSLMLFLGIVAAPLSYSRERSAEYDSLPKVFNDETDALYSWLRHKALNASKKHQIPESLKDWNRSRAELRNDVIKNAGVKLFGDLPLDLRETRSLQGEGFTVKNIYFQTRPGVYATANLFIPDGSGKFPAVVVMMGHSANGKLYENYQSVGQSLARDGYVALCVDPWGAGERSTTHGEFEYHGAALGASLMNIGETLLGVQITDNMRAVDLLRSLPYVDKDKIGATGASGGGNQTMWLAAIDERVKAAMPVVSVGTFDSYIGAHNCVCEVLPNGLTFTEEWGVLGMMAPRAIKMCNHNQESNPTFFPSEMLKSYGKAQKIFGLHGVGQNIQYELFDRPHGYFPEDREALLGWMDRHLKGIGDGKPKKEEPLRLFPVEDLMVFEKGKRDPLVHSTASFTRMMGSEMRKNLLEGDVDIAEKRSDLGRLLATSLLGPVKETTLGVSKGWERFVLESLDGRLLPVLFKEGAKQEFVIVAHSEGKQHIPLGAIAEIERTGKGAVLVDFSGTGESRSEKAAGYDRLGHLHTYARASLWLGETVMGNWVGELSQVEQWLKKEKNAKIISYHGYKSAGLTGIFYSALGGQLKEIHAFQAPVSYLFDSRDSVDHFGLGVMIPGILPWGDVSLAAAMSSAEVFIHQPVTLSGRSLSESELSEARREYALLRKKTGGKGALKLD